MHLVPFQPAHKRLGVLVVDSPMDWVYWSISPGHRVYFRPLDGGTYELVILVSPFLRPISRKRFTHFTRASVLAGAPSSLPEHNDRRSSRVRDKRHSVTAPYQAWSVEDCWASRRANRLIERGEDKPCSSRSVPTPLTIQINAYMVR